MAIPSLILASQSPRRSELLKSAGIAFLVDVANIPEAVEPREKALDYAQRIARAKCETVLRRRRTGDLVLAADTVVVVENGSGEKILGKPESKAEAVAMLESLQGRSHSVCTAYCLNDGEQSTSGIVSTRVFFTELSSDEIIAYVETGEPMDKAGSYAIQGLGARFVKRIEGSYTNVVGLPLTEVVEALRSFGIRGR